MRDDAMDYMKGLLVIGMVYTHIMQFFSDVDIYPTTIFSIELFNLITFSGFIFCFGYVNELAYYRKRFSDVYMRMLVTSLKTLVTFYISGLAYQIYVNSMPLDSNTIVPVLLIQEIPGWSEFLLSFSLIMLMGLILFPIINWLKVRKILFWLVTFTLLFSTFINYSMIDSPYLGLLIGTELFPTFPVIQYLPFYLIGIYFAKYRIIFKWKYVIGSIVGTAVFTLYLIRNEGQLPMRFPPSIYWIVGSTFCLYIYYLISKFVKKQKYELALLKGMGKNALFYLVMSNIFIFSLDNVLGTKIIGPWYCLLFTFVLLLLISFLNSISTYTKRRT
ncbi:hypothetical protein [Gracilibacillus kekensis]|uniref:hypothetical protein n=1 Tax=Gracilibacillus kekensis TaxID=1027249 RepID=UPI000934E937|nr:hypothetical protein [Gracilibacillus kekensis]